MVILRWIGKIFVYMSAILTGVSSLVREFVTLYTTNPNPVWQEKFFWSCVWIAFVVSAFIAWMIEHLKARKLDRRLTSLEENSHPKIEGFLTSVEVAPWQDFRGSPDEMAKIRNPVTKMIADGFSPVVGTTLTVTFAFWNATVFPTSAHDVFVNVEYQGHKFSKIRPTDDGLIRKVTNEMAEFNRHITRQGDLLAQFRRIEGEAKFNIDGLICSEEKRNDLEITIVVEDSLGAEHLIKQWRDEM